MLDWLRYFPLDLGFRENQDYITPRGPYFPTLRPQVWHFGDSRFYFKAPWSNSVYGVDQYKVAAKSVSPGRRNLLAGSLLSRYSANWMPNQRWQYDLFYVRDWFFVGPWFSGQYARLTMRAAVMGQAKRNDYEGASFFHPRVFETVIADFLSSGYGGQKAARGPCYRAPLNWKIVPLSPYISGAAFEIHQIDQGRENASFTKHLIFPVSHTRFVRIDFDYHGKRLVKNHCDITPMLELNKAIFDTFHLEVGPTVQTQWDEVKAICSDISLSPDFAELKWPIKPEDVGKAQALSPDVLRLELPLAENNRTKQDQ